MRVERPTVDRDWQAWAIAQVEADANRTSDTHLHVFPSDTMSDFDFAGPDTAARPEDLDRAAELLRRTLRDQGHGVNVAA